MNASSVDATQLAGISNVALASLQVALVQQAQFERTLEDMAARRQEEERAADKADKASASVLGFAIGGKVRAVEKAGAGSGAQAGAGHDSGNRQAHSGSGGGSSGSVNIRV